MTEPPIDENIPDSRRMRLIEEREHTLDENCWCNPEVVHVDGAKPPAKKKKPKPKA